MPPKSKCPPPGIGRRVWELRMARGWSLATLGATIGSSAANIMLIERGKTTQPQPRTLRALADAFDVAVADLLPAHDWDGTAPRGHDAVIGLARSLGVNPGDLRAMSDRSDPFYIGGPADQAAAEWFTALWHEHHFPSGVHLRRIHYRLLSYATRLPDGAPYENTWQCFSILNDASRFARILELVPADEFDDRRNPAPHIHAFAEAPQVPACTVPPCPDWELPTIDTNLAWQLFSYAVPAPDITGYEYSVADQPYHLEIWIEKSTMDDVLLPLCQAYGVNLVTSVGMQSITSVVTLLRRVARIGKPVRVFYISDFDPAGNIMPVGVGRQVEFWRCRYAPDTDLKLTPLALTADQVAHYQLPRIPVKKSDLRRKRFEGTYGQGAVELDALEALHPGELRTIVRDAIWAYYDAGLEKRLAAAATEARKVTSAAWNAATETSITDLATIREEARPILTNYGDRLTALNTELQAELEPLSEWLADVVEAIDTAADDFDPELPERPEPEVEPPDESEWLYDSDRDYLAQLQYYRDHRGEAVEADDSGAA